MEVYGRLARLRRKIGVRLLCLELLMNRHLGQLQAVAALLKEAWQEPCKMHWRSESRRLAVAVSILFRVFSYYITCPNRIPQTMRGTMMTIGKLWLALSFTVLFLSVDSWLSGLFISFCDLWKPYIVSMGFFQRLFRGLPKAIVSRRPSSSRIEKALAHWYRTGCMTIGMCADWIGISWSDSNVSTCTNINEHLTERHSTILSASRLMAVVWNTFYHIWKKLSDQL